MKNQHQVLLTLLASLGLLAMGTPLVSAKSVNSVQHDVSSQKATQVMNTNENKESNSKLSLDVQNLPTSSNKVAKNKPSTDSQFFIDHKHNHNDHKDQASKSNQSKSLSYYHTALPNQPELEENYHIIGDMNHFIQARKPYRYLEIGGNTRDLGGYPTANRRNQTKVDRIVRSADLDGLSKSGIHALQQLHVNKIVDLRYQDSKSGIQGHPDPNELRGKTLKGTGITYQKDSVYTYDEAKQFDHYLRNHDIHGEYYFYGAPSVTEPQAIRAYRTIFHDLLANKHGAVLFHCNLGRDRTGVTSALVLSALGVSRDVIYHDYLLTDHYHYRYHHQPYAKPAGELAYFFRTIDQKYGSIGNYLHREIGLSDHDLQQLRSMYLVPSDHHQTMVKLHRVTKHHQNRSNHSATKRSDHSDTKKGHRKIDHKDHKSDKSVHSDRTRHKVNHSRKVNHKVNRKTNHRNKK